MSGLSVREGEWVVVCDGAKALVLQNAGDAKFPNLKTLEVFEHKDPPTRDQAEQQFLTKLVHHLDAAIAAGKAKSVIVIAPPRALGMLRPAYSHAFRGALRAELDKDLVKLPVHEI